MSTQPILALWTSPRTVSTAFERMMMERGDVAVVHEPYSLHYYFGPDKRSTRYAEVKPGSTPEEIRADLEARAARRPVFFKDMAYHARDRLDDGVLDGVTSTFLVRDPSRTLPSLARHWPDFTDEEAGYAALVEMVCAVRADGHEPIVVDSDDLRADPTGIVSAYCAAVGLPFLPDALTWEPGMPDEWDVWEDWHRDAAASRGFLPPGDDPPPPLESARLQEAYDRCAPLYEELRALRLAAVPS